MTINYREDLETIMEEFKVLATQKRASVSYNDKGEATSTFTTVTTAYVDIQPATIKKESYVGEDGQVEVYSHTIYACYNVSGTVIIVYPNDRFYVGTDFYVVKHIIEHDNAHLEIQCVLVRGQA